MELDKRINGKRCRRLKYAGGINRRVADHLKSDRAYGH